ncbi:MAG: DUF192 domain-containing protein [Nitrososphaerales archaeon]
MSRNGILGFIGISIVMVMVVLIYYPVQPPDEVTSADTNFVIVGGKVIAVEIADEPDEMRRGLMFREPLPKDHGMLFVFDRAGVYSFWMKNVEFNLDIIWINDEGIVAHIERNVPPCNETCPSYRNDDPAKYVLEVNSGFADNIDLDEGSFIEIMVKNNS